MNPIPLKLSALDTDNADGENDKSERRLGKKVQTTTEWYG